MSENADLVVVGARVHGTPDAQAVAIRGTRIAAVGTAAEIRAVAGCARPRCSSSRARRCCRA